MVLTAIGYIETFTFTFLLSDYTRQLQNVLKLFVLFCDFRDGWTNSYKNSKMQIISYNFLMFKMRIYICVCKIKIV